MKQAKKSQYHQLHQAVSLVLAVMGTTAAHAGTCTTTGGTVNCSGSFTGGSSGGAIMVVPTNYPVAEGADPASTSLVGYSNKNDFTISSIGSMNVSVPRFSTLNIGSGSTSPSYGTAPDSTTTVITGLKAVPGYFDPYNGGTAPAAGDTPAQQAAKLLNAKPLVNYEGVDIQQAGTVNNFGVITNISAGNNLSPVAGNTFLVTNGPKVYTEAGSDNLPYRTIGVWVNGDDTKLNNYGVVSVGINNTAITNSQPGISSPLYTLPTGSSTAFAETFCSATDVANSGSAACYGKPVGTVKTVTVGANKPVVYGVLATSDSDDFQENVRINNYNKIGAYNFTSNTNNATVVAVEVKENIIDTHLYNAKGAVIEGVSSLLTASGVRSGGSDTAGLGNYTYATPTGSVNAIGTDNNAYQLYVDNYGTITSYGVDGSGVANGKYGVVIASSTGQMYLNNHAGANIFGDITVGKSENLFVFTNAGTLTGNIKITPDNSSLTPVAQVGGVGDISTPGNITNQIVIQPVINQGGVGNASGLATAAGSSVNAVGQITGSIYVATGTATHPFELDVQPLVGAGTVLKTGDTYQFAANNISVQSGAQETPNNPDGTAGSSSTARQINKTNNIHVISSALVNWSFVPGTTNQVVANVQSPTSIAGISGNAANALNGLLSAGSALGSTVQNLSSQDQVRQIGEQLRPNVNNENLNAVAGATSQSLNVIGDRTDAVRLASNGQRGMASGDAARLSGIWLQGFGFEGQQDRRENVDGYSANTYGFAGGADTALGDQEAIRVGAALSYALTNVNNDGVNTGNATKVDSYLGTLYGSFNQDNWYVNGSLGLARHSFQSKRVINTGGVNDIAKGQFDGWQYVSKLDGGYPIATAIGTFVPLASLTYSYLRQDGYTESSTSGTGLVVGANNTNSLRSGLGAKWIIPVNTGGKTRTSIELRTIWNHEFGDTSQDTSARFAVGGGVFTTQGLAMDRNAFNLGAGVKISDATKSLSVNYDAEIKDAYVGHTGRVQFRYDF